MSKNPNSKTSHPNSSNLSFHSLPKFSVSAVTHFVQIPTLPNSLTSDQLRFDVLSKYLPFIQKFRGKTIAVKYGGAAMKSPELQGSIISGLVLLSRVGLRPVLVHVCGSKINHWLNHLNIQAIFRDDL
ncbi:acetylglutamate kinase, chloroplastic-like [Neltuma alba]|uniref:acetylglutamate kinase, chloroplastic-like n=1 Tax=Neltuma alba TaxID=207710 RepID=UPI0010A4ED5D|nr:acetylglutamate kinase, chloroplastic-like [Prosopis alba]